MMSSGKNKFLLQFFCLSLYLFIRHTSSNEYYVPGSRDMHVKELKTADRRNELKVHSVSVLYRKKIK